MPQDIPVESSEALEFTPECLAALKPPPTFTLRVPTSREKRWMKRLLREEGVVQHGSDRIRAVMLEALKPLWGEDAYAENAAKLEAYWQASDDFEAQRKDNPDLEWSYDAEVEAAVQKLELDVARHHRPLATMRADNAHASEVTELALAAVTIETWSGIEAVPEIDRGYLTIDSIEKLKAALPALDERAKAEPGTSWMQVFLACTRRMFLSEDAEKNSASPSPAEAPPPSSSASKGRGESPAPASSTETPASA